VGYSDPRRRPEKNADIGVRANLVICAKACDFNIRGFAHARMVILWQRACKYFARAALAPGGFVKKIQSLSFLATLAIAIGMISWGSALHAQTTPSDQQTQQPATTPDTTPTQQQPQASSPEMPPQSQQAPPSAQTPDQSQTPDPNAPQTGAKTSPDATATDSQTFSGTVVKNGDKYVLKDDTGHVYDIDHQTDVAKFDGKRVRVQGTLDPSGKKIMVK
jgi:hypothetical protein